MIKGLQKEKNNFLRTIIYCRRFSDCADLYSLFEKELGVNFTEPPGCPDVPEARYVDMFMSCTDPLVKETILSRFTQSESSLRIVIGTVAFGMAESTVPMFGKYGESHPFTECGPSYHFFTV